MNYPVSQFITLNPAIPDSVAVNGYLNASISANTWRAYRDDLKHFQAWGGTLPATPEQIASYLAHYAPKHTVATLTRRLASLSKLHNAQQWANPVSTALVRSTFQGIRNQHGMKQRQVAPAIKEDILAMVRNLQGIKGIRDKALLLIGFAGAFRRSELASLQYCDIEHVQQGILVYLRRSKTDQAGQGRKIAIPYARGAICPVISLREWLEHSGITEGPIFRSINRHGHIGEQAITSQSIALVIKERAAAAGLDATQYSGHSLRAGLVTSAAQAGISSWKIRQQTGHKSDAMLQRYIRDANIFTDNAAGGVL
ncbi:site-specific recombinase XerD [Nitrosomonas oligotropha]|uniref:Site-specific recombinase XerD n=1 Tax=Nitrosomonas oligotropha TaxID=42354 RepID=A0A2T5H4N7_9PROT|nr:site-specific integrase [Nitrosomonas oligotropha]PTQ66536.1 site-specific recombinase XerD [Nitrosomonas oligotropha]